MFSIVPDKLLDTMTCSKCSKYLSVMPVKVYEDKSTLCGRCSKPDDDGVKSMVGPLAEFLLFKCINRYDGCTRILRSFDVKQHENSCLPANKYDCPLCFKTLPSAYLFQAHFTNLHVKNIIKDAVFSINLKTNLDSYYMYVCGNLVFIIYCFVDAIEFDLKLECQFIGTEQIANTIEVKFHLYYGESINYSSQWLPCGINFNPKKRFMFKFGESSSETMCEIMFNLDRVKHLQNMVLKPITNKLNLLPTDMKLPQSPERSPVTTPVSTPVKSSKLPVCSKSSSKCLVLNRNRKVLNQTVRCPVINCEHGESVNTQDLFKHFNFLHPDMQLIIMEEGSIKFYKELRKDHIYVYLKEVFVVMFVQMIDDTKLCHISSVFSPDNRRRTVTVRVNLKRKEENPFELTRNDSFMLVVDPPYE